MQSCPNLKNLQIGCDESLWCLDGDGSVNSDVVLPKLEFYYSRVRNLDNKVDLNKEVLLSCESLLYFGASLRLSQDEAIDVRHRLQHTFGNLVALDLRACNFVVLEILADVDHLCLKYLGLAF